MKSLTKKITYAGVTAALYAALTFIFSFMSFGAVQFRISEALCVLVYFTPAAIPGLTIGCLISGLLSGASVYDILFGTLATFIGAVGGYLLRKHPLLVSIPTIAANTIIVPRILKYAYAAEEAVPYMMLTVGIGELVCAGILGTALLFSLKKIAPHIFE